MYLLTKDIIYYDDKIYMMVIMQNESGRTSYTQCLWSKDVASRGICNHFKG